MSLLRTTALLSCLFAANSALAENIEVKERKVSDQEVTLQITLNAKSVLCTAADYSDTMLKVNVPGLRNLTVLDHTNSATGLPCVQGGVCTETNSPASIIAKGPVVKAPTRVQRIAQFTIDHDAKTCTQVLHEIVDVSIAGKNFHHERSKVIGPMTFDACIAM